LTVILLSGGTSRRRRRETSSFLQRELLPSHSLSMLFFPRKKNTLFPSYAFFSLPGEGFQQETLYPFLYFGSPFFFDDGRSILSFPPPVLIAPSLSSPPVGRKFTRRRLFPLSISFQSSRSEGRVGVFPTLYLYRVLLPQTKLGQGSVFFFLFFQLWAVVFSSFLFVFCEIVFAAPCFDKRDRTGSCSSFLVFFFPFSRNGETPLFSLPVATFFFFSEEVFTFLFFRRWCSLFPFTFRCFFRARDVELARLFFFWTYPWS